MSYSNVYYTRFLKQSFNLDFWYLTLMCFNHSLSKTVSNNFKLIDYIFAMQGKCFDYIVQFEFMTKNLNLNKKNVHQNISKSICLN